MTTAAERWVRVDGFERYEVSDQGRVRSWIPWRNTPLPRLIYIGSKGRKEHRMVILRDGGGKRTQRLVHRLVLAAFVGPCPEGMEVRHVDGNPRNNHVGNLAYGTHSENERDKVRHGTHNNASKTHCPRSHPYSPENTYRDSKGRRCRTCARLRARSAA